VVDYPTFVQSLGAALEPRLPGFRHLRSKRMLRRERAGGGDVVAFSASTQSSPQILVAFYFGRWFKDAAQIEKRCGWNESYYHIHQLSDNARSMVGLAFDVAHRWAIDIRTASPSFPDDVARAVEQIAFPFFERFTTLRDAQSGHVSKDSWCIWASGPLWHQLFAIDAALGDTAHLRSWTRSLDPHSRHQADAALIRLGLPPTDA